MNVNILGPNLLTRTVALLTAAHDGSSTVYVLYQPAGRLSRMTPAPRSRVAEFVGAFAQTPIVMA
jgi:hypothetical protein